MKKHSPISPSALARFYECSASIDESQKYPNRSSKYAKQGDEEHDQGEKLLALALKERGLIRLDAPNGQVESVEAGPEVRAYVQGVLDRVSFYEDVEIDLEERIVSEVLPGFGGTPDALIKVRDLELLHVCDYKSGAGVAVEARGNKQLLAYLLLARELHPWARNFRVSVCQPRTPGDAWQDVDVTLGELNAFEDSLRELLDGPRTFKAGDHCRFCPALAYCDEVASKAQEAAKLDFEPGDPVTPDLMERWLEVMEYRDAIKFYFNAIDEALLEHAKSGASIPGKKVIRAWGNTAWKEDEETTLKQLSKLGIGKRIATVSKLLTPTQLKKKGYSEEVEALSERPERGFKLVDESARGEPVEFRTAKEVFTDDC